MFWRRKKLDEDMCITAVVAFNVYVKRLERGLSLVITPSDVVQFALDRYGIEIPEDLAREALEKLAEMSIMKRVENGYTMSDVAAQAFALAHAVAEDVKNRNPSILELSQRGASIATTLLASHNPREVMATMKKLKEISECGAKAIERLAKSV
ncbi:MAG: hypothetical protein JHC33_05800 [Ignisphaera sp.]|nr:hypothetical protein [Ignisphaera sp.]